MHRENWGITVINLLYHNTKQPKNKTPNKAKYELKTNKVSQQDLVQ